MSPHQVFPLSGMNVAFRSTALPALYFPRMGSGSPYSRFDDIWCGLMLQRICAATGDLITVGEPWVRHDRASDVRENLRKEAPGAAVNQRYWRTVSGLPLEGEGLAECALSAARTLAACDEPYLEGWGRALAVWIRLCGEAARSPGRESAALPAPGRAARPRS
jgi:reversibly glycosylated polypeptide/UDP-arabinopyranose mutase